MILKKFFIALPIVLISPAIFSDSLASCDCGSIDTSAPCSGQSIKVTVVAATPNGGTAVDNVYNWTFNSGGEDARCGQFANGDYWVAPAAGQATVTLTSLTGSGGLSLDADPIPERTGLLGAANKYGNYSEDENVLTKLPVEYNGKMVSLVAGVQRDEKIEGYCGTASIVGACVDSYNVLTVLPFVPEKNGYDYLRPSITGEKKEFFKISDFDFSRLPKKSFIPSVSTQDLELIRQRWAHSTEIFGVFNSVSASGWSEGGRAFRSHILIDDYGAGVSVSLSSDILNLMSDGNTNEEKKKALSSILTYGQDVFKTVYDPPEGTVRWFGVGATQSAGRYPAAVLFAALVRDKKYSDLIRSAGVNGRGLASVGPHELTQIHIGKNNPVWGDVIYGELEEGAYWGSLLKSQCYDGATGTCNTSVGKRTGRDPYGYIDGPPNKPGAAYMGSSLGPQKSLAALMYLIPEVCNAVNYDELLVYIDRIQNYGIKTDEDPCVTPDSREDLATCDPYRSSGCNYYGVTWGPDPSSPGDCIKSSTSPNTKTGRFSRLDKYPVGVAYSTKLVENNWQNIKGSQLICQRERAKPAPYSLLIK